MPEAPATPAAGPMYSTLTCVIPVGLLLTSLHFDSAALSAHQAGPSDDSLTGGERHNRSCGSDLSVWLRSLEVNWFKLN